MGVNIFGLAKGYWLSVRGGGKWMGLGVGLLVERGGGKIY